MNINKSLNFRFNLLNQNSSFNLLKQNIRFFGGLNKNTGNVYQSILSELEYFIDKNPVNNDTQREIEKFVFNQFKDNVDNKSTYVSNINLDILGSTLKKIILDSMERSHLILTSFKDDIKVLEKSFDKLSKDDREVLVAKKICDYIGKSDCVQLMFSEYLRILSNREQEDKTYNILTGVVVQLGKLVLDVYYYKMFKIEKKKDLNLKYSMWFSNLDESIKIYKKEIVYSVRIGSCLIDILCKIGILGHDIVKRKIEGQSSSIGIISIPEKISRLLDRNIIYSAPPSLPMIVKPKVHSDMDKGGYLLNDEMYSENLIIDKKNYRDDTKILQDNIIYKMVNNLSSTPFKININLLDFLEKKGVELGLLIDEKFEDEFLEIGSKDVKKNLTKYKKNKLKGLRSKKFLETNILHIARIFRNHTIYFPVRLDKRGRIYCIPSYLNYQSSDLAKSLLLFETPGKIKRDKSEDADYLKIFGANCYGNGLDKKSFSARIDWVNKNEIEIVNFSNGNLLNQSKSKELFLAFCIEYKRYYEFIHSPNMEKEFKTYLPVQLDATCNGFQHLALLSEETKIWEQLNLTTSKKNNNSCVPKDFYNYILINVEEKINKLLNDSSNLSKKCLESCKRIKEFVLDRNMVKKTIMTFPYNATNHTMVNYMKESLEFIKKDSEINLVNGEETEEITYWYGTANKKYTISSSDLNYLVKIIKDIITHDFTKIGKLTLYLKCVANICTLLNIPITWNLPTGLQVNQSYLDYKTEQIKIFSYSKKRLNLTVADKTKLRKRKQVVSLMPNLIHSLDATSVTLLYDKFTIQYPNHNNFYSIHDCFATTSEKVRDLISILRSIYTILYLNDPYLRKFDKGIIENILNNYGDSIFTSLDKREIIFEDKKYNLLDVSWVLGENLNYTKKQLKEINNQYIAN